MFHLTLALGGFQRHHEFISRMVQMLCVVKVDFVVADDVGRTPLHIACQYNLLPVLEVLFSQKEDPAGLRSIDETLQDLLCYVDNNGRSALHVAVQHRSLECVNFLLKQYALRLPTHAITIAPPLPVVEEGQDITALDLTIEGYGLKNGHLKAKTSAGWTIMHTAVYYAVPYLSAVTEEEIRKDAIVQQLLSNTDLSYIIGTLDSVCSLQRTPLQWALRNTSSVANLPNNDNNSITTSTFNISQSHNSGLLVSWSPMCFSHHTASRITRRSSAPPAENVRRLQVLLNYNDGALRIDSLNSEVFCSSVPRFVPAWKNNAAQATAADITRVHEYAYLHQLLSLLKTMDDQQPVSGVQLDVAGTRVTVSTKDMLSAHASLTKDYILPPALAVTLDEDGKRMCVVSDYAYTQSLLHNNSLAHCISEVDSVLAAAPVYRDRNGSLMVTDSESLDRRPMPEGVPLPFVDVPANIQFTPQMQALAYLDGDTALSRHSFDAALHAAGLVTDAVREILVGNNRINRAFCVLRPPGHHAGPNGIVYNDERVGSSHGFCLFNNVAVGAGHAKCLFGDKVKKICIIDFDVHHGNGTEAIVRNLEPHEHTVNMTNDFYDQVTLTRRSFKPWLHWDDAEHVMFASVHGHQQEDTPWFYPGSGETSDVVSARVADKCANASDSHAHILNAGLGMKKRKEWRQVWRHGIIPEILAQKPDLLFVSAGFDAHKRDDINCGFVGVDDQDYYWLTKQLVKVANTVCEGRLVSVLEGGYRIQARIASPFAKSVAAHVLALNEVCHEQWDSETATLESAIEDHKTILLEQARRQRMEQARLDREALMREAELLGATTVTGKRERKPVDYSALKQQLKKKKIEQ